MSKSFQKIIRDVTVLEQTHGEVDIVSVEYDSRRVVEGSLFVAMRGESTDGNRYIAVAIEHGAGAVITDSRSAFDETRVANPELPIALVERGRRALAEASAAFFDHPEKALKLCGVTGTNGKTTTAFLIEGLLRSVGRETVLIGTIETHVGSEVRLSPHTTPESRDVLAIFADGVRVGASEAVMEMSSHALEQERVWRLPVDVAVFTNLTQDHLDYHGTMEAYGAAKAKLFAGVGASAPRVAVINADDAYADTMLDAAHACETVWTYGVNDARASFHASKVALHAGETRFTMRTPLGVAQMMSHLTGSVNVYNLLAASATAMARGLSLREIVEGAALLSPVPGRFETVANMLGVTVVVDYAHTDDALRNLITLARELVRKYNGRVITLFGCGGDRDRTKRPKMGRAAGEGSDLVVLTSDNPRSEDPQAIVNEALAGVRETDTKCIVELDRTRAIASATREARAGDIVLLAGKGHEKVQIINGQELPFDDVAVASSALRTLEAERAER